MKTLTISFLLLVSCLSLQAQDLAGRKIIRGSLGINVNSGETATNNTYDASLLYGKIRANNTYLAWGGHFTGSTQEYNNITNQTFRVGPAVEFGKFIPLVERFYLAPNFGGTAQAAFGDSKGVYIGAYVTPLRFMYNFSNHFMLTASLGYAGASFSRIAEITQFSLSGSLANNTSFGVFYTFK
ncbi:hypothetical protein [Leadbetterella sp. DM7]|uniref:hypothetical protein n=1 Tax=Leadbetterella sp. DM7 TaxID=3235085 RepID=UPI00349EC091